MQFQANTRNFSAFGVSLGVHAVILVAMGMIHYNLTEEQPDIAVDTVFSEERVQQEFSQELEVSEEISETTNMMAGATTVSSSVSGAVASANQVKIEQSESLKDPELQLNIGAVTLPGDSMIGEDLGDGEIAGETSAFVEGYGAALSRMSAELLRLMREQKVLVVWLFDQSDSMKDDQKEIAQKFHKIYEELGIQSKKDAALGNRGEVLLTSIAAYGKGVTELTPKPTAKIDEIRAAIDKIEIDESGQENMCAAISQAITAYGKMASRDKRKLVVVVVTDESGGDGARVEETLDQAKRASAPIYVLGREAVFGYPYARIRWVDPVYNLSHWLTIDRGPETAFPECLQWDGLHARHDAFTSGFGPYEQVRLARETGGIFFVLPGEEENLTGAGAKEKRKFAALERKEYQPLLLSRREYAAARDRSEFRKTLWNVILRLNPHLDKQLNMRHWHFPAEHPEFVKIGKPEFGKAVNAMALCSQALEMMDKIKPLRDQEKSTRWRAHYDLIYAQILAYRVRLFQYVLALDQHVKTNPMPKDPKHNEWGIYHVKKMLPPDPEQVKQTKIDLEKLKAQENLAVELFAGVIKDHAETPWSRRAEHELALGFGLELRSYFHDPRYRDLGTKIKLPKP
ncbi:MAG: VWA domain-containing protein [Planctomycetaceae bacterium]|nr:VWA domain-containing protein [Planctomycetaceae bacterium]